MNEVEAYNITITEFDTLLGPKWNLTSYIVYSLVPRRSGRGEERTPGIYCLRMRAFSAISRKMGYSRNLPCNDYALHRIFARTACTRIRFYDD